VVDSGPDVIPKSLQLIAGRVAQEFNQRKERKGAFWEDVTMRRLLNRMNIFIAALLTSI
jgi:hypothetical protein